MSIVYIASSSIPSRTASSVHVMKMCQAFGQEGHTTTLLASTYSASASPVGESLWHHYGIRHRFRIRYIPVHRILHGHELGARAAWYCRVHNPSVVYTRVLPAAAWTSLMGIPTVWETHDSHLGRTGVPYLRMLSRGRGIRRIVVITHALKDAILQDFDTFVHPDRILVLPDGVDLERFDVMPTKSRARNQMGLVGARFVAGYVGSLYAGRGIELIIELAKQCTNVFFVIVGGNPEDIARFNSRAAGLANIRFYGFVANRELPRYFAACDVLLMPHQRRVAASGGGDIVHWMSPMKMFEYMAAGRLIISSDLPVLKEVLNDSNAVLCSPDNTSAWIASLRRAMTDTNWRERLAAQARIDVRQYTWRRRVRGIMKGIDFR